MFDPVIKFLENISQLWKFRETIVTLCQTNPVAAGIVIFFLLIVFVYLIVTNVADLALKVYSWLWHPTKAAGVVAGLIVAAAMASGIVLSIRTSTAPVPVFSVDKDTFIGEPLLLKWTYDNQGLRTADTIVFYEVQSAADHNFQVDARTDKFTDGYYQYIESINASRYWRVRAVRSNDRQPISDWSGGAQFTQYDSVYKRIESTNTVLIYVSSAENEDAFKWIDTTFRGFDIALARAIVESLSGRLKRGAQPLTAKFVPIPWSELLDAPSQGRADMIVSSISKLRSREQRHKITFSETYFCTTQALLFPAGHPAASIEDIIRGKRVGYQEGTTSERVAKALKEKAPFDATPFSRVEQVVHALRRSDLDVGIADAPFAAVNRHRYLADGGKPRLDIRPFSHADFPQSLPSHEVFDEYAIAVPSSEDVLLGAINDALAQLKASGNLRRMLEVANAEYETAKKLPKGASGSLSERPWECPAR